MRFIFSGFILIIMVLFSGCSSTATNVNTASTLPVKRLDLKIAHTGEFEMKQVEGSESLYQVSYKKKGKEQFVSRLIVPAMHQTMQEVDKLGYQYFQVVAPTQISNLLGFPLTRTSDLVNFLSPSTAMPRHTLNMFETRKTLMDNQNGQDVVDVPFLVFGTTEFNFMIRLVKEPKVDEIVWKVKG